MCSLVGWDEMRQDGIECDRMGREEALQHKILWCYVITAVTCRIGGHWAALRSACTAVDRAAAYKYQRRVLARKCADIPTFWVGTFFCFAIAGDCTSRTSTHGVTLYYSVEAVAEACLCL